MATILGGTGADTLDFNNEVAYATVLGGTDGAELIEAAASGLLHPPCVVVLETTPLPSQMQSDTSARCCWCKRC